jgi:NADP-dependent 3-hydroxy acid dehydrogenase YdfG
LQYYFLYSTKNCWIKLKNLVSQEAANMKTQAFLDNVIILTGASSGIGRQLALQLAGQGALLALAARNSKKLKEVAEQCSQLGGRAMAMPTDVAEQSQCQQLVQLTTKEFGRIVSISSLRGKFPSSTADGYGPSKHAMGR